MSKKERQVHKVPQCEACKEREKFVDDVIEKIEKDKEKEPKKKTLFEFFESISQLNRSVINFKIDITWPKDMQKK